MKRNIKPVVKQAHCMSFDEASGGGYCCGGVSNEDKRSENHEDNETVMNDHQ